MGLQVLEEEQPHTSRGKAQCRKSSMTIFCLGWRLTLSDSRLRFPEVLAALINFQRELGYLFLFLKEHMIPWDWRVYGGNWSPGCEIYLVWERILSLRLDLKDSWRSLEYCVSGEIRETDAILTKRIRVGTTFPRGPGGNRSTSTLACGTLGFPGRWSAR